MSWKVDERSRGDIKNNKREQDSQEGNRRKKRKKYKHKFMSRTGGAGNKELQNNWSMEQITAEPKSQSSHQPLKPGSRRYPERS